MANASLQASGHPAASTPAGLSDDNLPVGMQIIDRRYADADGSAASAAFASASSAGRLQDLRDRAT
jgi:Asp-tRNA(Asn)/Glu-tRNA(Gln) amidotransferase A subunit family amidase